MTLGSISLVVVYVNPIAEIMNQMVTNSYPEDQRGPTLMAAGMTVFLLLGLGTPLYILGRVVSYITPKLVHTRINPKW